MMAESDTTGSNENTADTSDDAQVIQTHAVFEASTDATASVEIHGLSDSVLFGAYAGSDGTMKFALSPTEAETLGSALLEAAEAAHE
jgi:hypothetical protein